MGKLTNLVISPDSTFRTRPVISKGKVFLAKRDGEALIAEAEAVSVNPQAIPFSSWEEFLEAPDPAHLKPRKISPFAALLFGDTAQLIVSSEANPWSQQRLAGNRAYETLAEQWEGARDEAFSANAIGPAGRNDAGSLPTIGILASTFVIMIAVLLFAIIIIQERFVN